MEIWMDYITYTQIKATDVMKMIDFLEIINYYFYIIIKMLDIIFENWHKYRLCFKLVIRNLLTMTKG